jgi:Cd2+/Zn2+-exporting ATPase
VAKPEFFRSITPDGGWPSGEESGKTIVAVGDERQVLGTIEFKDQVRPGTAETVAALRDLGIRKAVIVTGDREQAAREAAETVGIDAYYADLLPDEKVGLVQELAGEFGAVAMIGDGINDAPALAAADVGVAMAAAGSDTAIETADIALMSDDIRRLVPLFRGARMVRAITRENIAFAVVVKALFLVLAIAGSATMWMAVFADMGASLIVIANALRLLSDKTTRTR